MSNLHLTLSLADMTQALRDSFNVDDIAREVDADAIADSLADAHGFHAELASKLDLDEIARRASFSAALDSEKLATLERMLDEQRTLHLKLKQRLERLEDLLGQAPHCREETPSA